MALPGLVALFDLVPADFALSVFDFPAAYSAFHPLDGAPPQLPHHLPRLGEVGMEPAEVDPVLKREDIGLVVQLKPQLCKFRPDCGKGLPRRVHVRADHIPVVHIHPGEWQLQHFVDIVHNAAHIKNGVDVTGLVAQGKSVPHLVDELLHHGEDPLIREPWP